MKKIVVIVIMTGLIGVILYTQDKGSTLTCESKVADTKSIIESNMSLLQSLLKEVADRQKELSQLQIKRDKIKEKLERAKTVAEWLGLDKEKICGPTVVIPDPYLCTLKRYYYYDPNDPTTKEKGFIIDEVSRCRKGINNGCGTIFTFLQIQPHIGKIRNIGGGGGGGFPPISIKIPIPIGNTVIGGGGSGP